MRAIHLASCIILVYTSLVDARADKHVSFEQRNGINTRGIKPIRTNDTNTSLSATKLRPRATRKDYDILPIVKAAAANFRARNPIDPKKEEIGLLNFQLRHKSYQFGEDWTLFTDLNRLTVIMAKCRNTYPEGCTSHPMYGAITWPTYDVDDNGSNAVDGVRPPMGYNFNDKGAVQVKWNHEIPPLKSGLDWVYQITGKNLNREWNTILIDERAWDLGKLAEPYQVYTNLYFNVSSGAKEFGNRGPFQSPITLQASYVPSVEDRKACYMMEQSQHENSNSNYQTPVRAYMDMESGKVLEFREMRPEPHVCSKRKCDMLEPVIDRVSEFNQELASRYPQSYSGTAFLNYTFYPSRPRFDDITGLDRVTAYVQHCRWFVFWKCTDYSLNGIIHFPTADLSVPEVYVEWDDEVGSRPSVKRHPVKECSFAMVSGTGHYLQDILRSPQDFFDILNTDRRTPSWFPKFGPWSGPLEMGCRVKEHFKTAPFWNLTQKGDHVAGAEAEMRYGPENFHFHYYNLRT